MSLGIDVLESVRDDRSKKTGKNLVPELHDFYTI